MYIADKNKKLFKFLSAHKWLKLAIKQLKLKTKGAESREIFARG